MTTIEKIRAITKSNQLNIDQALKHIEDRANQGESCALFSNLSEGAFQELFECGFRLSKFIDQIGMNVIKVEW